MRGLLAALALLLASCAAAPEPSAAPPEPVTVVLLRHAEKVDASHDPLLSPAGKTRAALLAEMLSSAGVTHLFATEFHRTRDTLAPLAEWTGLEIAVVAAAAGSRQVELLKTLSPGSIAVVAGHSNTIPNLVVALGGRVDPLFDGQLGDDQYHRLFLVQLVDGRHLETLELHFGANP